MNRDEIRKEFLDEMQLHITTSNLRNGKTWWDEYIDFLEKRISELHQPTITSQREMLLAYELKLWINPSSEIISTAEKAVDAYLSNNAI